MPKKKSGKQSSSPTSSRNLGNNYALSFKTGGGTHMTLVYLNNVKRGYEQERVKSLVESFLRDTNVPEELPLTATSFYTERCIAISDENLLELQQAVRDYLVSQKFDVRPLKPLHIDLRGQSDAVLDDTLQIYGNWNW